MYSTRPCTTPFFYTPAPGLSFSNQGYLSAVNDWQQAQGYQKRALPMWPFAHSKIYPMKDNTPDYFPLFSTNPVDINHIVDTTQNWPACAYPLQQ